MSLLSEMYKWEHNVSVHQLWKIRARRDHSGTQRAHNVHSLFYLWLLADPVTSWKVRVISHPTHTEDWYLLSGTSMSLWYSKVKYRENLIRKSRSPTMLPREDSLNSFSCFLWWFTKQNPTCFVSFVGLPVSSAICQCPGVLLNHLSLLCTHPFSQSSHYAHYLINVFLMAL